MWFSFTQRQRRGSGEIITLRSKRQEALHAIRRHGKDTRAVKQVTGARGKLRPEPVLGFLTERQGRAEGTVGSASLISVGCKL